MTVSSDLDREMTGFCKLPHPDNHFNSLEWAFSKQSATFPQIRHAIRSILHTPFTSVAAEHVFSCARYQTSNLSTTLNPTDYETRVTPAYHRRYYSDEEFKHLMGWSAFLFPSAQMKRIQDDLMMATDIPVGAHNRRNTEQARAKKAELRVQRETGTLASVPVTTINEHRRKKRSIAEVVRYDEIELDDAEIIVVEALRGRKKQAPLPQSGSAHRKDCVEQLDDLIGSNAEDEKALKQTFAHLVHHSLISIPGISSLVDLGKELVVDRFMKMVRSLRSFLHEGNHYNEIVDLVLVEFGSA